MLPKQPISVLHVKTKTRAYDTYTFSFDFLLRSMPNRFALMNISLNFGMTLKQTKNPATDISALVARVNPLSPSSIVSNLSNHGQSVAIFNLARFCGSSSEQKYKIGERRAFMGRITEARVGFALH